MSGIFFGKKKGKSSGEERMFDISATMNFEGAVAQFNELVAGAYSASPASTPKARTTIAPFYKAHFHNPIVPLPTPIVAAAATVLAEQAAVLEAQILRVLVNPDPMAQVSALKLLPVKPVVRAVAAAVALQAAVPAVPIVAPVVNAAPPAQVAAPKPLPVEPIDTSNAALVAARHGGGGARSSDAHSSSSGAPGIRRTPNLFSGVVREVKCNTSNAEHYVFGLEGGRIGVAPVRERVVWNDEVFSLNPSEGGFTRYSPRNRRFVAGGGAAAAAAGGGAAGGAADYSATNRWAKAVEASLLSDDDKSDKDDGFDSPPGSPHANNVAFGRAAPYTRGK